VEEKRSVVVNGHGEMAGLVGEDVTRKERMGWRDCL
jgi:hypothetical protein